MQTTKKKPSLIFILVGAVLAGYLGYLINGAWTEGIAFNEFMDRFKELLTICSNADLQSEYFEECQRKKLPQNEVALCDISN